MSRAMGSTTDTKAPVEAGPGASPTEVVGKASEKSKPPVTAESSRRSKQATVESSENSQPETKESDSRSQQKKRGITQVSEASVVSTYLPACLNQIINADISTGRKWSGTLKPCERGAEAQETSRGEYRGAQEVCQKNRRRSPRTMLCLLTDKRRRWFPRMSLGTQNSETAAVPCSKPPKPKECSSPISVP